MMRQKLSIGLVAAAFTVSLSPAWAQERERPNQSESRPSSSERVESAVPRGGDSGSTSSSGSTGSASSSSSSSSPSSSGASTTWMGGNSPTFESGRAPVHPDRAQRAEAAEQRRGGGTATGHAVPRGESGGKSAGSGSSTSAGSTSASPSSGRDSSEGRSRAVPTYSRPRDGRNPAGTAVERTTQVPNRGGVYYPGVIYNPYSSYGYDPYYSRYSSWSPYGYGYGLGYFSYDPFLFGGMGMANYYGGGYDPYYGGGGGGYSSGYSQGYRDVGNLRLKVKPANAQVHIDGYYVGVVDSFDGALQRLRVEAGNHKVELKAEGYEPVEFDVMIIPGDTITYKGEMKRR